MYFAYILAQEFVFMIDSINLAWLYSSKHNESGIGFNLFPMLLSKIDRKKHKSLVFIDLL